MGPPELLTESLVLTAGLAIAPESEYAARITRRRNRRRRRASSRDYTVSSTVSVEVIGGFAVRYAHDRPDRGHRRRRTVRYDLVRGVGETQRLDATADVVELFDEYPLPWN